MIYKLLTPAQSLDPAFRRQKPTRTQLDDFLIARKTLLEAINPKENEEHLKTHLRDFLAHVGVLGSSYYLNVSKRRDLVIRTGPKEAAPIGALIEVKKATNKKGVVNKDMVTKTDFNRKAFHELLLYYLEDREDKSGNDLRQLIITNGVEWFVFDALDFDRLFWRNTELRSSFQAWAAKTKADERTAFFYNDIAKEFLNHLDSELPFAYLDLRPEPVTDLDQLTCAKFFQAPHLLKAAFPQDANTLNQDFYEELLYIIGLEEVKENSRKLIKRVAPTEREHEGSLLRNTIEVLRSEDLLTKLSVAKRTTYGTSTEDQLFGIALELCLTWINRLLFLKLLEGQLRRYHAGNPAALTNKYRFLTPELLPDFATLNDLFFKVLNMPAGQRTAAVHAAYAHLPYLNSSLYEPSRLEQDTTNIKGLSDNLTLPLYRKSVLPAQKTPSHTLAYLLRFLDAYDFASEGDEQVQETHKSLISAAVLGLIFEKLNGYKDGSFYTPGFITMYMARHTLRRAVVQRFNRHYNWEATDVAELSEVLNSTLPINAEKKSILLGQYSTYFNTLTILDPAVGSGHFLVSALNELLAIKSELGLLLDVKSDIATGKTDYKRLRYRLTVARDELVVMHEDDDPQNPSALFQYTARIDPLTNSRTIAPAHTNLQRALFQEKRDLIEHTLFGVDLNPNSVRICRLRLWIELLKHAYYIPESNFEQLETLPNLDLNIKVGNSILSQFDLSVDLSDFKKGNFNFKTYLNAKHEYFNTRDREKKKEIQEYINEVKNKFTETIYRGDPDRVKIKEIKGKILRVNKDAKPDMFGKAKISIQQARVNLKKLNSQLQEAETKLAERIKGIFYRHAFEWRFEFPEVLDNTGKFRGFDVIVGNPPYIPLEDFSQTERAVFKQTYKYVERKYDSSVLFLIKGLELLEKDGILAFIAPPTWFTGENYTQLRKHLFKEKGIEQIINLPFDIFPDAYVDTSIFIISNQHKDKYALYSFDKKSKIRELNGLNFNYIDSSLVSPPAYKLVINPDATEIVQRLHPPLFVPLGEITTSTQGLSGGAFPETTIVDDDTYPFFESKISANYCFYADATRLVSLRQNLSLKPFYEPVPKILIRRIISRKDRLTVSYTENKMVFKKDINPFIIKNEEYDTKYVLGILASQLISYLYLNTSSIATKDDFRQTTLGELRNLLIPTATAAQQAEIVVLVNQVLQAKGADPSADTSDYEQKIDELVIDLYGLTHAEIALINGNNSLVEK